MFVVPALFSSRVPWDSVNLVNLSSSTKLNLVALAAQPRITPLVYNRSLIHYRTHRDNAKQHGVGTYTTVRGESREGVWEQGRRIQWTSVDPAAAGGSSAAEKHQDPAAVGNGVPLNADTGKYYATAD